MWVGHDVTERLLQKSGDLGCGVATPTYHPSFSHSHGSSRLHYNTATNIWCRGPGGSCFSATARHPFRWIFVDPFPSLLQNTKKYTDAKDDHIETLFLLCSLLFPYKVFQIFLFEVWSICVYNKLYPTESCKMQPASSMLLSHRHRIWVRGKLSHGH